MTDVVDVHVNSMFYLVLSSARLFRISPKSFRPWEPDELGREGGFKEKKGASTD